MTGFLLRASAVTRGWNRCGNESTQEIDPGEENSATAHAGTRTGERSMRSPATYR